MILKNSSIYTCLRDEAFVVSTHENGTAKSKQVNLLMLNPYYNVLLKEIMPDCILINS